MRKPEFKRLMQIGIIVKKVDEAVGNYKNSHDDHLFPYDLKGEIVS